MKIMKIAFAILFLAGFFSYCDEVEKGAKKKSTVINTTDCMIGNWEFTSDDGGRVTLNEYKADGNYIEQRTDGANSFNYTEGSWEIAGAILIKTGSISGYSNNSTDDAKANANAEKSKYEFSYPACKGDLFSEGGLKGGNPDTLSGTWSGWSKQYHEKDGTLELTNERTDEWSLTSDTLSYVGVETGYYDDQGNKLPTPEVKNDNYPDLPYTKSGDTFIITVGPDTMEMFYVISGNYLGTDAAKRIK